MFIGLDNTIVVIAGGRSCAHVLSLALLLLHTAAENGSVILAVAMTPTMTATK